MDNVLEGMKAVYKNKVYSIDNAYFYDDGRVSLLHSNRQTYVAMGDIKPLLKFPDKDSRKEDFWSCDLLIDVETGFYYSIHFDGLRWNGYTLEELGGVAVWVGIDLDDFLEVLPNLERLWSVYDNNRGELTNLNQETIDKLKEEIER